MAKRKNRASTDSRESLSLQSDWKHLLSAGSLLVAVLGTLSLGWLLQADGEEPPGRTVIRASIPDHDAGFLSSPRELPAPPSVRAEEEDAPPASSGPAAAERPDGIEELNARANRDAGRIRSASGGWTLQFTVMCDPAHIRPKLAALGGYDRVYLLPARLDDRQCFRLCWGAFATREGALAARGVPGPLASLTDRPLAKAIDEVAR